MARQENSQFLNTNGTGPSSGVDLEPGAPDKNLVNVTFRDCLSANNSNFAFAGGLHSMGAQEVSVLFDNCTASGGPRGGFLMEYMAPPLSGTVTFRNSRVLNTGEGGIVTEHKAGGPLVVFENVELHNVAGPFFGYNASVPCSRPIWSRVARRDSADPFFQTGRAAFPDAHSC